MGAFLTTTSLHFYLTYVMPHIKFSKQLIMNNQTRNIATIILRVGAHTATCTPFRLTLFFLGIGTLEQLSFKGGIQKWRECFFDVYKGAITILPFVMLGLYSVVPVRWGNLYMDSFNLFFSVILSYFANHPHAP